MDTSLEYLREKLGSYKTGFRERLEKITAEEVDAVLRKKRLQHDDLPALLSPAASSRLEEMAQAARFETLRHFGRAVQLFTPLYISNHCLNHCLYCGFSAKNQLVKHKLSLQEIEEEAKIIAASGLRHILVLTGDSPKISSVEYMASAIAVLANYFSSIGLEINALETEEYRRLVAAGADSLTMYQETYDEELYASLHPKGPKRDFLFRLDAPNRGAQAGFRSVSLGPLMGLNPCWQYDVFAAALHADTLGRQYPHLELGLSLPRIRPCLKNNRERDHSDFEPTTVNDRDFVQALMAIRLFLPMASISVSTRETPEMRDHLINLGITKISAGVSTAVGGHRHFPADNTPQFEISDPRSVDQMAADIKQLGYQPVFKDWEPIQLSPTV